eukprot:m.159587 g.159587  ORF g.159587 m.159587 type:complete len:351 (-) comp18007_c0_seq12:2559-3611(-)
MQSQLETIKGQSSDSDDDLTLLNEVTTKRVRKSRGGKNPLLNEPLISVESSPPSDADDGSKQVVENSMLLWIALVSFSLFAVSEFVAALLANSESLLGDSITMMVDGMTYGINLWADRAKLGKTERQKIKIDLLAPGASIVALVIVTIYVTWIAIVTLKKTTAGDASPGDTDKVNPTVMWAFATVNLILDFGNIAMFFVKKSSTNAYCGYYLDCTCSGAAGSDGDLNMLSALAHVGADTLRSVAVLIAGSLAAAGVASGAEMDASGAIVVSIAIVLSIIPIVSGLHANAMKLKHMPADDTAPEATSAYAFTIRSPSADDANSDESSTDSSPLAAEDDFDSDTPLFLDSSV